MHGSSLKRSAYAVEHVLPKAVDRNKQNQLLHLQVGKTFLEELDFGVEPRISVVVCRLQLTDTVLQKAYLFDQSVLLRNSFRSGKYKEKRLVEGSCRKATVSKGGPKGRVP